MRAIEQLAKTGRRFQAVDVTDLGVGEPDHPNHWGSVFAKAKALGVIEKDGYAQTRRPGRNKSVSAVWRGTPTYTESDAA